MTEDKSVEQEQQWIVFLLDQEEFAVPITQVQEIVKPETITKLPHAAHYIAGVANLRGEVIPIICLRKRLGLPLREWTPDTRIMVVDVNRTWVGLMVDAVVEVQRIASSQMEPPPTRSAGLAVDFVKAVGKIEERLLILLDTAAVVRDKDSLGFHGMEKSSLTP